jgi:Gpi18-like mannosyltransferase
LGSLYFLLSKRSLWAAIFFGLAISFKLQAIFFLPVLLIYVLKREMPWYHLFVIPLVALLLLVPAYVAGRDVASLLTVYVEQIDSGGVGAGPGTNQRGTAAPPGDNGARLPNTVNGQRATGALSAPRPELQRGGFRGAQGTTARPNIPRAALANAFRAGTSSYSALTYNAPSIYQWFSGTPLANNAWIGITLAALAVALAAALLLKSQSPLTTDVVMNLCLMCLVVIPFLLPKMHERYFYMADVFCILYAFYFPREFYIPILMQFISLLSYAPFLLNRVIIDLRYVAIAVLALAILSWTKLAKSAFQSQD